LIAHQEIVITLSQRGYIKRLPLETYRPQRRGGRGITGMVTREADAVHRLIVADTHDSLLFFTDRGRVFQLRAFDVPDASRQARGIPLINLIDLDQQEVVTAVVAARDFNKDCMVVGTAFGEVKKTSLSEFKSVRRAGLIAMNLEKGDYLVSAKLAHDEDDALLVTSDGQSVRFPVSELRLASRSSGGVRGIKLAKNKAMVCLEIASAGDELLTISKHGYGKRTPIEEYPVHHRGGSGVITFKVVDKTGPVVTARMVHETQELIVISQDGIVLRTRMEGISVQGRSTQGVSVITPGPGDAVASIAVIEMAQPLGGNGQGVDEGPPPEQLSLPGQDSPKSKGSSEKDRKPVARIAPKSAAKKAAPARSKAPAKPAKKSARPAARKPAGKPKPKRR
jgi:DNA gyrase subunit A